MAEIHQRLGRPERAFDCRSRAWLTDVESGETLAEMEALGLAGGMHGELVAALEKGAVEAGDPVPAGAAVGDDRARCSRIRWAARRTPIEAWRSALAARPDDRDAFLALERLLSGAARSGELVDVLEKHLEIATDAGERKAIAKRIAVLYEDALKQREQAVRAWETVLEIDAERRRRAGVAGAAAPGGRRVPRAGRRLRAQARAGRRAPRSGACCSRRARASSRRS